jgi:formylglycine-generating enzyme required for sulfatase activity
LEKERELRYQTVEELEADLRAALEELGGGAAQEVGLRTVPPARPETVELESGPGAAATGDQRAEAARFGTNLAGRDGRTTPLDTHSELQPGGVAVTDPSALADRTPAGPAAEPPPRTRGISDTARQHHAERTSAFHARPAEHAGPVDGAATLHIAAEPLTPEPPPSRAAEEDERRAAEAAALAEREEHARRLAEQEEVARREAQARARAAEEVTRARVAAAGTSTSTTAGPAAATPAAPEAPAAPARSRRMLYMLGGVAGVAMSVGMAAVMFFMNGDGASTNANANAAADTNVAGNANANAVPPSNVNSGGAAAEKTRPDLVALPGGSFSVGAAEVPPLTDELKDTRPAYLLWVYAQWPAHAVKVGPFRIDRTEVTNAEYDEFVKETGHAPPPDIWDGGHPKQGEGSLPVSNVTFDDARAFAAWRSKRDGLQYRLPTENEWEFAARGGDPSRVYPWGRSWAEGSANLDTGGPRPVGSFPRGRTPQGVEDMLGNVWEWTSSEAAMYPGNDRTVLRPEERGKLVVRGGSFKNRLDGDEPVTTTARRFVARTFRDPSLGFRLVRVEP